MSGYVEKAAVLRIIFDSVGKPATEIYQRVREVPEADVIERKSGKWKYQTLTVPGGKGQTYAKWSCSKCKGKFKSRSDYCPGCGARMEKEHGCT